MAEKYLKPELHTFPDGRKLLQQLQKLANRVGGNAFKEGLADSAAISHSIADVGSDVTSSIEFTVDRIRYFDTDVISGDTEIKEKELFKYTICSKVSKITYEINTELLETIQEHFYLEFSQADLTESEKEQIIEDRLADVDYITIVHTFTVYIETKDNSIHSEQHAEYYIGDQKDAQLIDIVCVDHTPLTELSNEMSDSDFENDAYDQDETVNPDRLLLYAVFREIIDAEDIYGTVEPTVEISVHRALGIIATLKARVYEGAT